MRTRHSNRGRGSLKRISRYTKRLKIQGIRSIQFQFAVRLLMEPSNRRRLARSQDRECLSVHEQDIDQFVNISIAPTSWEELSLISNRGLV